MRVYPSTCVLVYPTTLHLSLFLLETLCDKMICILRRKDYISEV